MRDPYEVLGLDRKASSSDIKSAFRRSAKKLHPDANKNDPKAASRFAELNAAYEILGDEKKRKAFDRGEIDAEGKPRFRGFEGFGGGAGPRPGAGFGPEADFETFSFGPEGFTRTTRRGRGGGGAGFGGFEDILREAFGGMVGARRTGTRSAFETDNISSGADVSCFADCVSAGSSAWNHPALAPAVRQRCRGQDSSPELPTANRLGCAVKAWPARPAPAMS